MALSSWLRSTSNRFRFFARPVPLATTLGLVLVSIFAWEYHKNPEWFNSYSFDEQVPNRDIDLSGLTPEEQVAIADIDNLTVLFNELGIEAGGIPNIRALADDSNAEQRGRRRDGASLNQPTELETDTGSSSPFAQYLEQYQFSVQTPNLIGSDSSTGFNTGLGGSGVLGNAPDRSASYLQMNPLTAVMLNQAAIDAQPGEDGTALEEAVRSQDTAETSAPTQTAEATDTLSNYSGEFGSQTVTVPGVSFPVLPTLPQMSPPPGTTGYTPPASLELMPPLPGSGGTGALPVSGASSLSPSSAGVPNLSGSTATPNLTAPQVNVNNSYVTPYTPTVPTSPTAVTAPAPFSAPRPPGSYIGGGYINTFSNPSGPSN